MNGIFIHVLNVSLTAGLLVLAVVAVRAVLQKRAPRWVVCLMWAVVALRLALPFSVQSDLSLVPEARPIKQSSGEGGAASPYIDSGIKAVDNTFNPVVRTLFGDAAEQPQNPAVGAENAPPAPAQPLPSQAGNPAASIAVSERSPFARAAYIAAIVWICGAAALILAAAIGYLRLRRRVAASVPLGGKVYVCDDIKAPFILGVLRPRIYLPSGVGGSRREHILAHERAHIRRLDIVWKPLGFALLAVYWFNPLMWLAYILLCRDIELACDERVIAHMGTEDVVDYSQTLLDLSTPRRLITACPLAFGEVAVKTRVKSVLNYKKPALWVIVVAIAAVAAVAVCFATVRGASDDTSSPEKGSGALDGYALQITARSRGPLSITGGTIHTDAVMPRSEIAVIQASSGSSAAIAGMTITVDRTSDGSVTFTSDKSLIDASGSTQNSFTLGFGGALRATARTPLPGGNGFADIRLTFKLIDPDKYITDVRVDNDIGNLRATPLSAKIDPKEPVITLDWTNISDDARMHTIISNQCCLGYIDAAGNWNLVEDTAPFYPDSDRRKLDIGLDLTGGQSGSMTYDLSRFDIAEDGYYLLFVGSADPGFGACVRFTVGSPAYQPAEPNLLALKYGEYFGLDDSEGLKVYVSKFTKNDYNCVLVSVADESKGEQHPNPSWWTKRGTDLATMREILSTYSTPSSNITAVLVSHPLSSYLYSTFGDGVYSAEGFEEITYIYKELGLDPARIELPETDDRDASAGGP